MEESLENGIKYFKEGNTNKALYVMKKILEQDPNNKDAMYYSCLIYRKLKKWSSCKKMAWKLIKRGLKTVEVYKILSDVYFFEGSYKKAIKFLKIAIRNSKNHEKLQEKLKITKEKFENAKRKKKLALLVCEKGDNFTDDLVEYLSEYFWVKKVVLSANLCRLYFVFVKALSKGFIKPSTFRFLLTPFSGKLRRAIKWADYVWFEWANEMALVGSYLRKPAKKKFFIRLHRYEAFTDIPKLINWKNIDGLVLVSGFMREILKQRRVDISIKKVEIIYNGVDLEKFEFKERQNGYNIGWVAHIIMRKNLHMAIEIIKKLVQVNQNYKLHVAGSFDDRCYEFYLKHLVKELRLENNVIFYGWVDDIDKWWEDKNYLLSTSIHESFGYNIAEAMVKGIKPLIHNFYNARELFDESLLFNTTDEAVEKILNGSYDSKSYRQYIIDRKWTVEEQAKKFKEFILSL